MNDNNKSAGLNPGYSTPPTEDELLAYADGQLHVARRGDVEAYLAEHPEAAAKITEWRRQTDALQALYGHIDKEPVPPRLDVHRLAETARRERWGNWQQMAAAIVLVAGGGIGGWAMRTVSVPTAGSVPALMSAAIDAHELFTVQPVHPVEVAAAESGHLTSWLSNTIDRHLVMPDLSGLGYKLVGGRILPGDASSAAQVMYQDAAGQRVTLYITPHLAGQKLTQSFETVKGVSALYWANPSVTCTVVGQLPRAEMEKITKAVFATLSPSASTSRLS